MSALLHHSHPARGARDKTSSYTERTRRPLDDDANGGRFAGHLMIHQRHSCTRAENAHGSVWQFTPISSIAVGDYIEREVSGIG